NVVPPDQATTQPGPVSETIEEAKPKRKKRKKRPEDIELVDVRPQVMKAVLRRARLPLLVIMVGLAVGAGVFFSATQEKGRIRLIAPQRNQAQVAPETLRGRVHRGF